MLFTVNITKPKNKDVYKVGEVIDADCEIITDQNLSGLKYKWLLFFLEGEDYNKKVEERIVKNVKNSLEIEGKKISIPTARLSPGKYSLSISVKPAFRLKKDDPVNAMLSDIDNTLDSANIELFITGKEGTSARVLPFGKKK